MQSLSPDSVIARQHALHTQERGLPGAPEFLHSGIKLCPKVTLKRQSQPLIAVSLTKMAGLSASFSFSLLPISNIWNCL